MPKTVARQAEHFAAYERQTEKKMPVSGVTQPLLLPGIPYEGRIVPTLHALLGTGNHLAQGFNNALEELDNTDLVALAKARELRDVIAELEALILAYRSQLLKALEEAEVRAEAAEEEEGDEDEDEGSAQASYRFAYEAAIDAIAGLREKAEVARVGDPTRAVRSRSKRQVTAGEKVAEGLEEEAEAIEIAAKEAWAAAAALDQAKAECDKLNEGSAISGRLVKIYNELLVAENIEKQVYWNGKLVGPHLWRLFQRYAAIFATLRGKDIELSFSPESLNSII